MIGVEQLKSNIVKYMLSQIDYIADKKPMIALVRPLITPAIENTVSKAEGFIDYLKDKDGNIDIDKILTEIIDNVKKSKPFTQSLGKAGEISISEGKITYKPPFMFEDIVFDSEDLDTLKKVITSKE